MEFTASVVTAVLKAVVGEKFGGGLTKDLVGISIDGITEKGINEITDFINREKLKIDSILSKENRESMGISEDYFDYVVTEIKELLPKIDITDEVLRQCKYDSMNLSAFLWDKYKECKNDYIEYESEIKRCLFAGAEALIKLVRESENFEKDVLIHISNSVDDLKRLFEEFTKNDKKDDIISKQCNMERNLREKIEIAFFNEYQENPSIKLMKMDSELFPTLARLEKMNWSKVEESFENNINENKLFQIIEKSWNKRNVHLSVEGEGGIGKTVSLLTFREFVSNKDIPIIYIPLRKLFFEDGKNLIKGYIQKRTLNGDEEMYNLLEENFYNEWGQFPNIILILDGINEIPVNYINVILKEIEDFSYRRGIQLIISSRYDVRGQLNLSYDCWHIKLKELSKGQIEHALKELSFDIPSEDDEIWNIINYPLMLYLYARNRLMYDKISSKFTLDWMDNTTSGAIVWNYLQCEIARYEQAHDNTMLDCVACMELYAPYIVYQMHIHNQFLLSIDELNNYIDFAYQLYKRKDISRLHIKKVMRYKGTEYISSEILFDILTKRVNIFRETEEGKFQLMHQKFRDCFAAIHLINIALCSSESIPLEWTNKIDNDVLLFMAHFMIQSKNESFEESLWKHIWELAKRDTTVPNIFYTQMEEIYRKVYGS